MAAGTDTQQQAGRDTLLVATQKEMAVLSAEKQRAKADAAALGIDPGTGVSTARGVLVATATPTAAPAAARGSAPSAPTASRGSAQASRAPTITAKQAAAPAAGQKVAVLVPAPPSALPPPAPAPAASRAAPRLVPPQATKRATDKPLAPSAPVPGDKLIVYTTADAARDASARESRAPPAQGAWSDLVKAVATPPVVDASKPADKKWTDLVRVVTTPPVVDASQPVAAQPAFTTQRTAPAAAASPKFTAEKTTATAATTQKDMTMVDVSQPILDKQPEIRPKMQGPAIVDVQRALTILGYYKGKVDGYFGADTQDAVLAVERDLGLERDGFIDANEYAKIMSLANAKLADGKDPRGGLVVIDGGQSQSKVNQQAVAERAAAEAAAKEAEAATAQASASTESQGGGEGGGGGGGGGGGYAEPLPSGATAEQPAIVIGEGQEQKAEESKVNLPAIIVGLILLYVAFFRKSRKERLSGSEDPGAPEIDDIPDDVGDEDEDEDEDDAVANLPVRKTQVRKPRTPRKVAAKQ